jgi:hypothetical protein
MYYILYFENIKFVLKCTPTFSFTASISLAKYQEKKRIFPVV